MKIMLVCLLLVGLLSYDSNASAEKTVLAGGCFWCMEADFEKLEGVKDVVSGFTGGTVKNPTYSGNHKGHYEAVEINYDPETISYNDLLDHYWVNIDPFDANGQFCDKGHSYLSAIFVANEKEKKLAEQSRKKVVEQFPNKKVVTPILDASTFYPIKGEESYHQDYYKKSPIRYNYYRWGCGRDKRLKDIWGARLRIDSVQVRTRTEEVEGVGIEQDILLDLYLQEFRRQGDLDALITFIERLPEDQAQERAAV